MLHPLSDIQYLNPELTKRDVHVWTAFLNQSGSQFQILSKVLSQEEQRRAARFRFERDMKRFIVGHGILRVLLGFYLNIESSRVRLSYGEKGKPTLADKWNTRIIHFNMSKSDDLALYAFTRDHEIGIDVERMRDIPEMDRIVERFFSVRENASFKTLPEDQKREGFFNCWTRKEAFLKATGDGLFYPLERFVVSLRPGEKTRILSINGDEKAGLKWLLKELKPAPGFVAAVAVLGQNLRFRFFQFDANNHYGSIQRNEVPKY